MRTSRGEGGGGGEGEGEGGKLASRHMTVNDAPSLARTFSEFRTETVPLGKVP
jgi:hypothetical protein